MWSLETGKRTSVFGRGGEEVTPVFTVLRMNRLGRAVISSHELEKSQREIVLATSQVDQNMIAYSVSELTKESCSPVCALYLTAQLLLFIPGMLRLTYHKTVLV